MIAGGIIQHKDVTSTAHLGNHWTVGAALAWFPAFLVADALQPLLEFPRNGFSLPYNIGVIVTTAFAGLGTLLLGYAIARPVSGAGPAALAAIGTWFGTTLMWYSLAHATMAHAISACSSALVFAAAIALRRRGEPAMVLLAGLAVGFAFAVRPQNAPLAAVPLIVASVSRRHLPWYAGGMAAGALPQIVVSWFLYGSPLGFLTGGGSATPFAAFQRVWAWEPLLSWYHGLFTWTPFAAAGVAGLLLLLRHDRRLAVAGLVLFASQWIINATLERSFWGALSFGQRRFDSCIVVFLIGAAALLRALSPPWRAVVVAVPSAWTMALFLAARGSMLDLSRYVLPADLMAAQWSAVTSAGAALVPLGSTPAPFQAKVALLIVLFVTVLAVAVAGLRRLPIRGAAALASSWFLGAALFLFWCGTRDASRIDRYRDLIERNRIFATIPGGADVRFGLLRDELDYLRRSGRIEEAEATARELAVLERARAAALREKGLP